MSSSSGGNQASKDKDMMSMPGGLLWSASLEVQKLLGDVPLVTLGVLGFMAAALLLATRKMTKSSIVLVTATGLAFLAGAFDMISMLQGEDVQALDGIGIKSLDVFTQIFQALFASLILVYPYLAFLQLAKCAECSFDESSSSLMSEKSSSNPEREVRLPERILAHRLVRYFVLVFMAMISSLEFAWRHFLGDMSRRFTSIYHASNALQFAYLTILIAAILSQSFGEWMPGGRLVTRLLALLAGIFVAWCLHIVGFAIVAFVETPLARLLNSIKILIWLLDLLIRTLRVQDVSGEGTSRSGSLRSRGEVDPASPSARISPFRLSTPRLSPAFNPAYAKPRDSAPFVQLADPTNIARGPTIRRSSRLPSWLPKPRSPAAESSPTVENVAVASPAMSTSPVNVVERDRQIEAYDTFRKANQPRNQTVPSLQPDSLNSSVRRPRSSSLPYQSGGTVPAGLFSKFDRSVAPSMRSVAGTYNEKGIRLDSPTELDFESGTSPPSTGLSSTGSSAQATVVPVQVSLNRTALPPTVEEDSEEGGRETKMTSRSSASPAKHDLSRGSSATTLEGSSPASRRPSVYSHASDVSLSNFPRPPLSISVSSYSGTRRPEIVRHRSDVSSFVAVYGRQGEDDWSPTDASRMSILAPPTKPFARPHGYTTSMDSVETYASSVPDSEGELSTVPKHKGFNVTSFIGASAGPAGTTTTFAERAAKRKSIGAEILRANSLKRQTVKFVDAAQISGPLSASATTSSPTTPRAVRNNGDGSSSITRDGVKPLPGLPTRVTPKTGILSELQRNGSTATNASSISRYTPFAYDDDDLRAAGMSAPPPSSPSSAMGQGI